MSSSPRNRGSTCVRRGSTTSWPCGPRSITGSRNKKTARPRRSAASRSQSNENVDPHDLDLRRFPVRVCDDDPFAVAERSAAERGAQALRESECGELDDPAVRHGEAAILFANSPRDARPGRELLGRELPRVLTLAQNLSPVRERPHLAEDAVADHAAHLWKEARLDSIEPTGHELRTLFRAGQRTRENQSELGCALRERLRHRATRGREGALFLSAIGALGVTADFKDRHRLSVGVYWRKGGLIGRPSLPLIRWRGCRSPERR